MSLRQLLGNGIADAYFPNATDCSGPHGLNETNYDGRWGQDSNHCALEHWLWWVAQIILFLGYTLFGGLSTTYGLHRYRSQGKFRLTMVLAFLILAIWGGAFGMSLEQMIFAVGLILINLWHLTMCILFDKTISVNPYLMNLYHKMFDHDNINLEDVDFYNLVQEKAFLKTFQRGQFYCHEHDKPNQLSILLHGKMSIYKHDDYQRKDIHLRHESTHHQRIVAGEDHDHHGAYVGTVYPYEFIDSYEWLSMQGAGGSEGHGEHQMYQVSIKVSEDEGVDEAVILTWKKPMLEAVFKEFPRLRTCMHAVVGKDIAEKMLRITGHNKPGQHEAVDMVRKAHGVMHFSKLADIANRRGITERETSVLPSYSRRAGDKFDDEYEVTVTTQVHDPSGFLFWKDDGFESKQITVKNLTDKQRQMKNALGAGPWCELPDETLAQEPWTSHLETIDVKTLHKKYGENHHTNEPNTKDDLNENFETISEFVPCLDGKRIWQPEFDDEKDYRSNELKGMMDGMRFCKDHDHRDDLEVRVVGVPAEPSDYNHYLLEQEMHSLQRSRLRIANYRLLCMHASPMDSLQPTSDISFQNPRLSGDLLHYFQRVCPELRKKDLYEILKWGKWRSYYRPGTTITRQGEEANYLGILLQGKLAGFTEDEITRSKTFVGYVEKYNLVGSEDFSSKFRCARRTVEMPEYRKPGHDDDLKEELQLRSLPQDCSDPDPAHRYNSKLHHKDEYMKENMMYYRFKFDDAKEQMEHIQKKLRPEVNFDDYDEHDTWVTQEMYQEFKDRIDAAYADESDHVLITNIPAVMFVWDIKDLKRLMLADPHVESHLSTILRGDITFKLDNAELDGLATRVCGVRTQAVGDHEVRACNINPE
jgi:hypothetical protein